MVERDGTIGRETNGGFMAHIWNLSASSHKTTDLTCVETVDVI